MSLVERAVAVASARFRGVPRRDLRAFAEEGLWEATATYDPSWGVPFERYAWRRVYGAIRDEARKRSAFGRRQLHKGFRALPYDDEQSSDDENRIEEYLDEKLRLESLRALLEDLPEQERALLEGHYFHGREFQDVAAELGMHKSWASRVKDRALDRLRKRMLAEA